MKDSSVHEKFVELRAIGRSYADISKERNVGKTTVVNWAKKFRTEISNLKAMELDSLQRCLKLNDEARIEMFGEMLARLKEEFAKRELNELPTEKLLDQIAKISVLIAAQQRDIKFKSEAELFDNESMLERSAS